MKTRTLSFSFLLVLLVVPVVLMWRVWHQNMLNRTLVAAVYHNDTAAGLHLLVEGAEANANEADNSAPDWFAVFTKQPPRFLQKSSSHSMLTLATRMHNTKIMAALIQRGAEVNCRDNEGSTPLCKVMEWSGDYSEADKDGKVVRRELIGLAHLLLVHGANPNICSPDGEAPIDKAWQMGDAGVVRDLLERGADLHGAKGDGMTPWSMVIFLDQAEVLKAFLDNGLAKEGNMLLNSAAGIGATQCVRLLLDRGADVQHRDEEGSTPLICAASYSHWDRDLEPTVQLLLKYGADINATDHNGNMALMKAVERDHIDLVHLLLAQGANPNHPNKPGKTPRMLAQKLTWTDYKDAHIIVLLKQGRG